MQGGGYSLHDRLAACIEPLQQMTLGGLFGAALQPVVAHAAQFDEQQYWPFSSPQLQSGSGITQGGG